MGLLMRASMYAAKLPTYSTSSRLPPGETRVALPDTLVALADLRAAPNLRSITAGCFQGSATYFLLLLRLLRGTALLA